MRIYTHIYETLFLTLKTFSQDKETKPNSSYTSLDCFSFSHLRQLGVLLHPKSPEGTPRRSQHLSEKV